MREKLQQRLEELHREYAAGQNRIQELQAQQVDLQQTLLRIGGAIQVLEELLEEGDESLSGEARG